MAGFAGVTEWAAAHDRGARHITTFRKQVASAATVANDFIDYTYFAGNPVANFYASSPLEAAYVDDSRGIHLPNIGGSQWLKDFCVMTAASSATSTTNQNQRLLLADYLMYYPFIDTDAVGELQEMVQTVPLPRYNTAAVLGPELFPSIGSVPWSFSGAVSAVGDSLVFISAALNDNIYNSTAFTPIAGKFYAITYTVSGASGGGVRIISKSTSGATRTSDGVFTDILVPGVTATSSMYFQATAGATTLTVSNISVREVLSRGEGAQIMCVAQSASSTIGTFTLSYTNQDGIPGRTTQSTFTKVVAGGGVLVTSPTNSVAGSLPFIGLQAGDTGVRSVESCTFSAAGGGLMAIVLVKPILHTRATQECRRTTTGNLESYGAATHMESFIHMQAPEIKQGAILGVVGLGNNGTLASSILTGVLTTQWGT